MQSLDYLHDLRHLSAGIRILNIILDSDEDVGFLIVGAMMIVFGMSDQRLIVIPIMLLLPLAVIVPEYIFDEIENKVIDANGLENYRAEVLSIYNMGVNLVEIIFLFASAYVSRAGISLSFILTGCTMGVIGVAGFMMFSNKIEQ